jgi:hypothetical protein
VNVTLSARKGRYTLTLGVMPEIRVRKNIWQMFGYLPNFFIFVSLWK